MLKNEKSVETALTIAKELEPAIVSVKIVQDDDIIINENQNSDLDNL